MASYLAKLIRIAWDAAFAFVGLCSVEVACEQLSCLYASLKLFLEVRDFCIQFVDLASIARERPPVVVFSTDLHYVIRSLLITQHLTMICFRYSFP